MQSPGRILALAALALVAAIALFGVAARHMQPASEAAWTAPGLEPLTPEAARTELFTLLPALLLVVYDAFARTDEAEIYDTLAQAAAGEALEALYLERAGAMVGGGLTEPDQTIHEMKLIRAGSRSDGDRFQIDAEWQVIGTVGHSEHLHVRGNSYLADLVIAPVDGAWKITDFTLRDVSRDSAGEIFAAPES